MTRQFEFNPGHYIRSIRMWHNDDGDICAITFEFNDGPAAQIALPIEILPIFESELVASQERCNDLRQPEYKYSDCSPDEGTAPKTKYSELDLVKIRKSVDVLALRVTHVSLFEQVDGSAVGIRFDHPDGRATQAVLPIEYVPVFLQKIRDTQAVAQS